MRKLPSYVCTNISAENVGLIKGASFV